MENYTCIIQIKEVDKMKNKGFTLIELLGVIIILATISLVAFPAILNFMSSSNGKIDQAKEKIIISAAKDYVTDNNTNIAKITTKALIENGYITNKEIIKSVDENQPLENSCVKVTEDNGEIKYTFIKNCSP